MHLILKNIFGAKFSSFNLSIKGVNNSNLFSTAKPNSVSVDLE
jgi:hypothetical protein